MTDTERAVWAAAYAQAWRQNRAAIDWMARDADGVLLRDPPPLPAVKLDAMCRREADACVAVLRAGEAT